ncbi:MAG: transglycosylase family protein [Acidimicrobiales bacterium]
MVAAEPASAPDVPLARQVAPAAAEPVRQAPAPTAFADLGDLTLLSAVVAGQARTEVPPPPTTTTTTTTAPPTTTTTAAPAPAPAPAAEPATGRCGGDLPPCWVMMRESGGNITAKNPSSSASGKWQFINSTWAGFGGYAEAWMAPESVQDAKARQLWAGGAGCGHWSAC